MAWETRGSGTYYYTAKRVDGRVVKSYVGGGQYGADMAHIDHWLRGKRIFARDCERVDREVEAALLAPLRLACDEAGAVAALLVQAAGYHRHDRGRWRKRRMETRLVYKDQGAELVPASTEERIAVVHQALANKTDKALQEQAAAILKMCPEMFTTAYLSDVQRAVDAASKCQPVERQMFANEAGRMRQKLMEGRDAADVPFAERLLIERVVACRFDVARAEEAYDNRRGKDGSCSFGKSEHLQKNIDRAHTRYLKAIKTLAEVKRLSLPTVNVAMPGSVQVNNGDRQINVTTGGA